MNVPLRDLENDSEGGNGERLHALLLVSLDAPEKIINI